MEEKFEIIIEHHGVEEKYWLTYRKKGYLHQFVTELEGIEIVFEPDEEGTYRTINYSEIKMNEKNREIIELIKNEIEQNFS